MAVIIRVLAQLYPNATVENALYTCATTSVVISSLIVCNNSNATDYVTVRIAIADASNTNAQLIYSAVPIQPNMTIDLTAGITLANTDVIKVTSANGTCAFSIYGQENT